MDHDAGIWERLSFSRTARSQQKRAHRSCHAETDGGDIAWDELEEHGDGERAVGVAVSETWTMSCSAHGMTAAIDT